MIYASMIRFLNSKGIEQVNITGVLQTLTKDPQELFLQKSMLLYTRLVLRPMLQYIFTYSLIIHNNTVPQGSKNIFLPNNKPSSYVHYFLYTFFCFPNVPPQFYPFTFLPFFLSFPFLPPFLSLSSFHLLPFVFPLVPPGKLEHFTPTFLVVPLPHYFVF